MHTHELRYMAVNLPEISMDEIFECFFPRNGYKRKAETKKVPVIYPVAIAESRERISVLIDLIVTRVSSTPTLLMTMAEVKRIVDTVHLKTHISPPSSEEEVFVMFEKLLLGAEKELLDMVNYLKEKDFDNRICRMVSTLPEMFRTELFFEDALEN